MKERFDKTSFQRKVRLKTRRSRKVNLILTLEQKVDGNSIRSTSGAFPVRRPDNDLSSIRIQPSVQQKIFLSTPGKNKFLDGSRDVIAQPANNRDTTKRKKVLKRKRRERNEVFFSESATKLLMIKNLELLY